MLVAALLVAGCRSVPTDLTSESPATIRNDGIFVLFGGVSGIDRIMSGAMAGQEVQFGFTAGSDIVVRARPHRDRRRPARRGSHGTWTPLPYELRRCYDDGRGNRCPRIIEGLVYSSSRGLAVHVTDQALRDSVPSARELKIWREWPSTMRGAVVDTAILVDGRR